ncbi:hypothetical protein [Andreprevotia sp. IGB-42]|uniref:hypothetical protein n=1 Tax=Andreprevotia sp. IGB-42 TaxID=2497473 RepID=UPI00135AE066|nr:hypothetical protein [Andreprevotia sp. IGB-42]
MKTPQASTSSQHSVNELVRPTLTFQHPMLQLRPDTGPGLQYHHLSTQQFSDVHAFQEYEKSTGLTVPSGVTRDWSGNNAPTAVTLSRRGSISGHTMRNDGGIDAFRFHSLPTSEAMATHDGDLSHFMGSYEQSANTIISKATNSAGNKETVNAVLADHVRMDYEPDKGFVPSRVTHGSGFSGKAIHSSHNDDALPLYQPSVDQLKRDGKSVTPSQAFHSEPMMTSLDNQYRSQQGWPELHDDRSMFSMVTSAPNQVCFNCGRMLHHETPQDSVTSGMPGVPFGGQKPGAMPISDKRNSTVVRATPLSELVKSPTNTSEVGALFKAFPNFK